MAIDLTAGLDPATDYMLAEKPADPDFRESASMWIFDQRGEIAVPPWVPGAFVEEARALLEGQEGLFISPRYEQLCTARGTVKLGNDEWSFEGSALRVHRQGVRNVEGFWGHCWQSALFPDGRGFG